MGAKWVCRCLPPYIHDVLFRILERRSTGAKDLGGYLIGLARHVESLFCGITWGTDQVLLQTRAAATQAKLSIATLPTLADVDRREDLVIFDHAALVMAEHSIW